MPDEAPEPEVQDQPTPPAPQEGTSGERDTPFNINEVPEDYREHVDRYAKQLQGDYTRKTQELASQRTEIEQRKQDLELLDALRNDPETQKQVLQELAQLQGYEMEGGQEQDPLDEIRAQLGQLQGVEEQRAMQAQADQLASELNQNLDALAKRENRKFTDEEREWLLDAALVPVAAGTGNPDVEGAFRKLAAAEQGWQKRYLESKNAPSPAPSGRAGSPEIDLSDPRARRARMAEIMAGQGGS